MLDRGMDHVLDRRRVIVGAGAAAATLSLVGGAYAHRYTQPEEFQRQLVNTRRPDWKQGELHVVPDDYFLYFMLYDGLAIRYGVGVGRGGLYHAGTFYVERKAKWPSWRPTRAMIRRDPEKYEPFADGMPGGRDNPLGARALYLYDERGRDTYLRIHGTNQPSTIGSAVSNGCARLTNEDITDLYPRVEIGARVNLHEKNSIV